MSSTVWGHAGALVGWNRQGPNINRACDTHHHSELLNSRNRGRLTSQRRPASSLSSTGYIKLSGQTDWPWTQPKHSLLCAACGKHTSRESASARTFLTWETVKITDSNFVVRNLKAIKKYFKYYICDDYWRPNVRNTDMVLCTVYRCKKWPLGGHHTVTAAQGCPGITQ